MLFILHCLFADNTYLTLADKNLQSLEQNVNYELNKINHWLQINKLTLSHSKTNYMQINKTPLYVRASTFKLLLKIM